MACHVCIGGIIGCRHSKSRVVTEANKGYCMANIRIRSYNPQVTKTFTLK